MDADDEFVEIAPPTESELNIEEVKEYMEWLGGDLEKDQDLMYIAKEALLAELPKGWKHYQTKDGTSDSFYFNTKTGESTWDHPLDKHYKELFSQQKKLKEKRQNQKYTDMRKPKFHKKIQPPNSEKSTEGNQIKLTSKCLKHYPFQNFEKDFTFVVNGSEFKANKFLADLLSPLICKMHMNDPTIDHFVVNTTYKGDFNYILNLFDFEYNKIPYDQIPFVTEIIELFEANSIKSDFHKDDNITIYNVVDLLKQHEKFNVFYQNHCKKEIDFLASNFYKLFEIGEESEVKKLSPETIELIISHPNLVLNDEDQLLNFVNDLYSIDNNFSNLYEYVDLLSTSKKTTNNFLDTFQFEFFNKNIWNKISSRLQNSSLSGQNNQFLNLNRYFNTKKVFAFDGYKGFNGILKNIGDTVEITSSSVKFNSPRNVIDYSENQNNYFSSEDSPNSWILFDFKKSSVSISNYSICSDFSKSDKIESPKSWVIEGSNDKEDWTIIDEQKKVVLTKAKRFTHTFSIENPKENSFRFIRMRLIDTNWCCNNIFKIGSIEFYGELYDKS